MSLAPVPFVAPARSTFDLLPDAIALAAQVAGTEFVPAGLRDRPEAVVAAILYGAELGVTPMESLAEISVIEGRPAISAQLMRRLVLQAGHELWAEEATTVRCTLCARRAGSERVHKVTWTMDDAKKAGLAGRPNWTRYPREMLIARATASLCRTYFADELGAARYVPDELEGGEAPPDSGIVPETHTEGPVRARRRRTTSTPAAAGPAPLPIEATATEPAGRPPLPDEPLEGDRPSEAQRRKMHAALRDAGIEDRDARLRFVAAQIGRTVASATELTAAEASIVIDAALMLVNYDARTEGEVIPLPLGDEPPDDEP